MIIDVNQFDYEKIKNSMFTTVRDKAYIGQCRPDAAVYHADNDLCFTMHVLVDNTHDYISFILTNEMLQTSGITVEEAYKDAVRSQQKMFPPKIGEMGKVLRELDTNVDIPGKGDELYVVTNSDMYNGASVIFYPGVMETLSGIFDGGYYILPSSVHEVLATSDRDWNPEVLYEMVYGINREQVLPRERMADALYHYDAETKTFRRVV